MATKTRTVRLKRNASIPNARRFTPDEQKGHRDALTCKVEQGILPAEDTDYFTESLGRLLGIVRQAHPTLSEEAAEILLGSVQANDSGQGSVIVGPSFGGSEFHLGGGERAIRPKDQRTAAKYKHALKQLLQCGLVEATADGVYEVTYEGYLAADELMVNQGNG